MFERKTFDEKFFEQKTLDPKTFANQTLAPKSERLLVSSPHPRTPDDHKQRRLMVAALALLLVALGFVLYRDRDFWFPDTQEAEEMDQPAESVPATAAPAIPAPVAAVSVPAPATNSKHHAAAAKATANKTATKTAANTPPVANSGSGATAPAASPAVSANRTVLPPLEVEVVAGDTHSTIRPGSNSVRVDLQPGTSPQAAPDAVAASDGTESAAHVTSNAAERVQMSADTAEMVSHPVNPGYPLLARQMRVQGSVILRALISKDGTIQDLHVLSGPHILAAAAQDAVRQWRFKPHYLGGEAVETQAKITVNFTISTN